MTSKEKLTKICISCLQELQLLDDKYKKRLKEELKEVDSQDHYDYFLNNLKKGHKWDNNTNNLFIPYLLGLCNDFNINESYSYTIGEFPDIDVDYLEEVSYKLKTEWAPKQFGEEYIANIGTHTTYNVKQSLTDMARIFGASYDEVLNVTKHFPKKDDEGDAITWDTALDIYPAFKKYVEDHPDIADAAKRLCGRNRNMGQHAGGFIISSVPLSTFVPLVLNKKDDQMITAFAEGQSSQDLGQIGLVKYDLLRIKTQKQIADAIGLIRKRHGVDKICAMKNSTNWSDISYLNDPKCIAAANSGDLRFVFQFDSDGMRKLVRKCGVSSFDDLMSLTALYRPGPLNSGLDDLYCDRKNGKIERDSHPLIEKLLDNTYGIMIYQESVMSVLNTVGGIPLRDCYALIKAISKKKLDKFAKYKDQFIERGQITLGYSKEKVIELWQQIEAFSAYGFNKSHACAYTYLSARQLYLKSHYPIEFYCSTLNNIGGADSDEKIRDCKRDAESHGVRVNAIDINKSDIDFTIVDDEIYYGFSKIKFVGETAAQRIIELRNEKPFENFTDFLTRFGTESKVVQAMVSLRVFKDADPLTLWRYYEAFKKYIKSKEDKKKNFKKAMKKYRNTLAGLVGDSLVELNEKSLQYYLELYTKKGDSVTVEALKKLQGGFRRSVTRQSETAIYDPGAPKLDSFKVVKSKMKPELIEMLLKPEVAEFFFYGFGWTHPLTNCELANGLTFERHRRHYEGKEIGPIEGQIIEDKEVTSKKGTKYHILKMIDANWETRYVQVWMDDYERFKNDFAVGSLVRLQVSPPDARFPGAKFTLKSYPKWQQHTMPSKANDVRVVVLKPPMSDNYDDILNVDKSQEVINKIVKMAKSTLRNADDDFDF